MINQTIRRTYKKVIKNQSHLLELSLNIKKIIIDTLCFDENRSYENTRCNDSLSFAEVMTVLGFEFLSPQDKIILSNGHISVLLYAFYYLIGHPWYNLNQLKKFRKIGYNTPGYPEYNRTIAATTGPLGQGLGTSIGMAIAAKKAKLDHKIFCTVGIGCLMEGLGYEAISLAGHLKLDNLIVLFDKTSSIKNTTSSLAISENQKQKFINMGWKAIEVNGNDLRDIRKGLSFGIGRNNHDAIDSKDLVHSYIAKPTFIELETSETLTLDKIQPYSIVAEINDSQININQKLIFNSLDTLKKNLSGNATNADLNQKIKNQFTIKNDKTEGDLVLNGTNFEEPFFVNFKFLDQWRRLNYLIEPHLIRDYFVYCKAQNINSAELKEYEEICKNNASDANINNEDFCPKSYYFYEIKTNKMKASHIASMNQEIIIDKSKFISSDIQPEKQLFHHNIYERFTNHSTANKLIDKFTTRCPEIFINPTNKRYFNGRNINDMLTEMLNPIYVQYHNHPISINIMNSILNEIFISGVANVILGSIDLNEPDSLKINGYNSITSDNFFGNTLHCGARENIMASACNGLALSGYIPICSTLLAFSDYARSGIRMSAIMNLKVIYLMTHDSATGRDGSTYQSIEQLTSFRAMPNIILFRPYLVQELLLSFKYALSHQGPSIICIPRQKLELLELEINQNTTQNLYFYHLAGYLISGLISDNICLISTGPEIELSLKVRKILQTIDPKSFRVKIISIPSISLLDRYMKNKPKKRENNNLKSKIRNETRANENEPQDFFSNLIQAEYLFTIESGATLGLIGIVESHRYKAFKQYGLDNFGYSESLTPKTIARDIVETIMQTFKS